MYTNIRKCTRVPTRVCVYSPDREIREDRDSFIRTKIDLDPSGDYHVGESGIPDTRSDTEGVWCPDKGRE